MRSQMVEHVAKLSEVLVAGQALEDLVHTLGVWIHDESLPVALLFFDLLAGFRSRSSLLLFRLLFSSVRLDVFLLIRTFCSSWLLRWLIIIRDTFIFHSFISARIRLHRNGNESVGREPLFFGLDTIVSEFGERFFRAVLNQVNILENGCSLSVLCQDTLTFNAAML